MATNTDCKQTPQNQRRITYSVLLIGVGLLCILQASLNICLHLYQNSDSPKCCLDIIHNLSIERNHSQKELQARLKSKDCPEGWLKFQSSCYYISDEWKSWDEGRRDCIDRGAYLVIINSREEQAFISRMRLKPWIGLTDRTDKGTWTWVNGTPLVLAFWKEREPSQGNKEHCVTMYYDSERLFDWNNLACTDNERWMCEKSI